MGFWSKLKEKREAKKQVDIKETENLIDEIEQEETTDNIVSIENKEIKNEQTNAAPLLENDSKQNSLFVNDEEEKTNLDNKIEVTKKQVKRAQKELKKKQKEALKKEKVAKMMAKSSLEFSKDIKKLSKKYKEANNDFFEELEEVFNKNRYGYENGFWPFQITYKKNLKNQQIFDEIKEALIEELYDAYDFKEKKDTKINFVDGRLNIFMLVGVNGTGKTTSLSKIANFYAEQGKKVLIAAGDTFRAGAVEQLEEWISSRLNDQVDLIKGKKSNQDPASVVFDAVTKAKEENYDLLLIDTAGRLQNKINLMKELEKMHDIVRRIDRNAPHEVLLVIDATTGQNGVIQAQEFSSVTNVSGIVLTKMDGTSKGGIALAIKDQLNIPVKLMGIGEQVEDITTFDIDDYVYGLASGFMDEGEIDE